MLVSKNLAKCFGLWFAEGDNKTTREITFTNNCYELINFFHNVLKSEGLLKNLNPRVYVYSPDNKKYNIDLDVVIKHYKDKRASKAYYIYRVASVDLVKEWYSKFNSLKENEELYSPFLQGFFAGEGNVKCLLNNHMHRSIRIAQGNRNLLIEKMLDYQNISYSFSKRDRSYDISGRKNLEKAKLIRLCSLHPLKSKKFEFLINSYKADVPYYSKGWLTKQVFNLLDKPKSTKELSLKFNRSFARLQDVLIELKKENRVTCYWEGRKSYLVKTEGDNKC